MEGHKRILSHMTLFIRSNSKPWLERIQYLHLVERVLYTICNHVLQAKLNVSSGYIEYLPLVVASLEYNIILGKPWLTKINSNIDWKINKVKFKNGKT